MRTLTFSLVASITIAGCSTTPVSNAEAEPVPQSRILDSSLLRPQPGAIAMTIKKPGTYMLAAQNNSPCGGRLAELQMVVGPNQPTTYRMGFGSAGEFALQPTAF